MTKNHDLDHDCHDSIIKIILLMKVMILFINMEDFNEIVPNSRKLQMSENQLLNVVQEFLIF